MSRAHELNPMKPKLYNDRCDCYKRHGAQAMNPMHKCSCVKKDHKEGDLDKGLKCLILR